MDVEVLQDAIRKVVCTALTEEHNPDILWGAFLAELKSLRVEQNSGMIRTDRP